MGRSRRGGDGRSTGGDECSGASRRRPAVAGSNVVEPLADARQLARDCYSTVLALRLSAQQAEFVRAACLAVLLVTTAACGGGNVSCTDMLPLPQVKLLNEGPPVPNGAVAQACLAGDCATGPWRNGQASVVLDALPREGSVDLQLRTLAAEGSVLDEDAVSAEVRTVSPNGPGCEPQVGLLEVRRLDLGEYGPSDA